MKHNLIAILILVFASACSLQVAKPETVTIVVSTPTPNIEPVASATTVPAVQPTTAPNPTAVIPPPTSANSSLIVINFPGGVPNDVCSVTSADGDAINIRSGPGTNYNVIGLLITPAQLVNGQADWYQIALPNGGTGWVASSVTSVIGMCGDGDGLGPGPAEAICHFYSYGVNGNLIDLAAFPTGAPVLIVPDQEFVVTAQAGNWVRLRINSGREGWILSVRGMLSGNCQGLPTEAIPAYPSTVCTITMTQATDVYAQPNFSTPILTIRNEVVVQATARTVDGWFGFDLGTDTTGQGLARLNWLPAGMQGGSHMITTVACDSLPVVSYP